MLQIIDSVFSRITQHAPFLYHQDRLFYLANPSSDPPKGNFVKLRGVYFSLQPGFFMCELENYLAGHSSVRDQKKVYLRSSLSAKLVDQQELAKDSGDLRVVSFIFERVLPLLIDAKEDLYKIIGEEESTIKPVEEIIADAVLKGEAPNGVSLEQDKQELIRHLESNFSFNLDKHNIGSLDAKASLFSRLFRVGFVYINDDKSSQILLVKKELKNARREDVARLSNKYYDLVNLTSEFSIFPNYQYDYLFDASLCISALRDLQSQDEIIAKQRELRKRYSRVLKDGGVDIGRVGFLKYNNVFFVYASIPKFAMQHPFRRNEYSMYPGVRVAARVYFSDRIHVDGPYVVECLRHPFIHDYSTPFSRICILDEQKPVLDSPEKNVVNVIINGVASLTNGLTKKSIVDHHGGDPEDGSGSRFYDRSLEDILAPIRTTKEKALAEGYLLTNQFLDKKRKK